MGYYFCKEQQCQFREISDRTYRIYEQCKNFEQVKGFTTKTKCNSCNKIFSQTSYYCNEHRKMIDPLSYEKCYNCKAQIYESENILYKSDIKE